MKILIVDNYDSYTYNIVSCLQQLQIHDNTIVKNDAFAIEDALQFEHIIISPGPKTPLESGFVVPLLQRITTQNVLGICLGHQAIAVAFNAPIFNLTHIYHGASTQLQLIGNHSIFNNLAHPITVGLYHSWAVSFFQHHPDLEITSLSTQNIIMSLKHKYLNIHGVQFHPESFITKDGIAMFKNWLCL